MKAAYAGSFDPPTLGHEEIIQKAAALFDELLILVSPNSAKTGLFSAEQRKAWLEQIAKDHPNVCVEICAGLTVEAARAGKADVLLRSMRSMADYEGEANNAWINAGLQNGLQTLFLMGDPAFGFISSSNVRELLKYHQSIEALVPRCVFADLQPEFAADQTV